jgi:hypothetical protein
VSTGVDAAGRAPAQCCLASSMPVSFPEAKTERPDLPRVGRRRQDQARAGCCAM